MLQQSSITQLTGFLCAHNTDFDAATSTCIVAIMFQFVFNGNILLPEGAVDRQLSESAMGQQSLGLDRWGQCYGR